MRGISLMVASTVAFAGMHALIRYVSDDVHPFQIAFFRSFFGLVVFTPWIMRSGLGVFATERLPLHVLRSVMNVVAMFMFFTSLSLSPLARVTALGFTAPIFAALMSVILLKERFRFRRWAALICGFAGTLVILRPGILVIDLGSVLVLGSALIWGLTLIVIKMLGRTESSITITAYMNLLLTVFAFVPTLFVWSTPSLDVWFWLLVIGVLGTLAQVAVAESLKMADASSVMPFDFLKLIWAAFLGYFMFAETVDLYTWVGAAIVVGSTIYLAYRESRVAKQPVLDQSNGSPT